MQYNINGQLVMSAIIGLRDPATLYQIICAVGSLTGNDPASMSDLIKETVEGGVTYGFIQKKRKRYIVRQVDLELFNSHKYGKHGIIRRASCFSPLSHKSKPKRKPRRCVVSDDDSEDSDSQTTLFPLPAPCPSAYLNTELTDREQKSSPPLKSILKNKKAPEQSKKSPTPDPKQKTPEKKDQKSGDDDDDDDDDDDIVNGPNAKNHFHLYTKSTRVILAAKKQAYPHKK